MGTPWQSQCKMKSKSSSSTTCIEAKMESLGIACWDFAYPTGRCSLTATSSKKNRVAMRTRRKSKTKPIPAPHPCVLRAEGMPAKVEDEDEDERDVADTPGLIEGKTEQRASWQAHRTKSDRTASETRTYLLSSPTISSISYPQTQTTISTLLMTPHTQLIYLVPQSHITSTRVCEISRLPRAGGSAIQVLPVSPSYSMSGERQCTTTDSMVSDTEMDGLDGVVNKVLKYTKARVFDGYLAFEDDRDSWTFLEKVGKGVKKAADGGTAVRKSGRK
ncbi:uncharacterized protein Z518_04421 [Rhinocladiella mackenziei CBS 650.93]|uniref:Uncharacterized protein n=1 Tax=Rhinocladiella mackenziei CBS 650.93 TaxID=1442369 RepID=A0A0D2JBH0_9EURO|nr:uncharacterized protein Z518_04421 [Rhinocladiella mackenziei CBS 650.93]KIX06445.1 hypothetical protein Z518_04421 [Rhinocladiella mackenziei CBS 650.93]